MQAFHKIFTLGLIASTLTTVAQDRVNFSGAGRGLIEYNQLMKSDTTNSNTVNSGYQQVDLGIDIRPIKNTFIKTQVRFRNPYGAFYGFGTTVELRQMLVKGVAGNHVKYQLGDIDIKQSKYTLFNHNGDGQVNEAEVFQIGREISEYENFNTDNYWRQKGAQVVWAIDLESFIEKVSVDGFILKNKATKFLNSPDIFQGGASVHVKQSRNLRFSGNYINLWDVKSSSEIDVNISNPVVTGQVEGQYIEKNFRLFGDMELGRSSYNNGSTSRPDMTVSDYFAVINAGIDLKAYDLKLDLGLREIGPYFISSGAQTKRMDFNRESALFNKVGNGDDQYERALSIHDITSVSSRMYNRAISATFMAFDPRMSNALPYGDATPNRRGFNIGAGYRDSLGILNIRTDLYGLQEIQLSGGSTPKRFLLARTRADFSVSQWLALDKDLTFSMGHQLEKTTRTGTELEQVNLTSNLVDVGIEAELFDQFYLLAGAKMLFAKGDEQLDVRDDFNAIISYSAYEIDEREMLTAAGVKYAFNDRIGLSLITEQFQFKNNNKTTNNYHFNQNFLVLNMKF